MNKKLKTIVEEYQCPGCICGKDISCYKKGNSEACSKHIAGTFITSNVGKIFLGMPIGFNRLGCFKDMHIDIFENIKNGCCYDIFNVPVWKYLDINGNTLVRGISPRINIPFLHIYIGNYIDQIDCLEITVTDIKNMD